MSEPRFEPLSGNGASTPRPKDLPIMTGWAVVVGLYQIFLAWRFGSFFDGTEGLVRVQIGGVALEPVYALVGAIIVIGAWGGWHLRPWAYWLACVLQGLIFLAALIVVVLWLAGKDAPVGWLLLDCLFGAYNVWWLRRRDVRRAFRVGGGDL